MENKSVILIYFLFLILISGFVSSLPFIENRGIIMDNNLPYIQKEIYCAIGGSCILNELTVSNLSVIGSYFNISVLNYNVTGTIYADDYAFQNGNTINDTFVNIIGDTMTGNLTIDTGGVSTDVELRLQTDVNENSYLYYMESDTGILGFMAWYDGSGGGAYKIDAIDGTGTIIPKMEIDRDDYDVDFFVNENLNDNNITGIQCLELNGEYICSWDSVNASSSSSSNCSTCNISDLINVDTTDVGNAYILVYHAASGNWRATSSGSLFGWNIDSSGGFLYNDSDTAYYNYTKLDDEYVTYADFNKEIWGTNNITTRKDMIVWGRYCNRTNCYTVTDFLASSSNVSSYNDTLLKQSIIDNSTSDRLYTDNINTTSNIEELGFNTTNNLKSYFDSLYQVIGSYVTHIFLDTNYYNKTQSDAIETSIRTSIIDNSTSNNLYTDGRVDSINNNSGMINYTDVNYTTGYFEDVIIYRDLTIGEDLICTDCILPGALHLMYFGLSDFADDVGYQLIAEAFTVVNFTELINGYTNITYDSELTYINNCSIDNSCDLITYDSELTYTSLDGLDIVNQSMLDNDTIIRNHNTSWITNNQDPDTTINNCSVDNSCNLITYDSELNYYTTTDFLIDYSTTGFYTDDNITANEIYALTPHTNRSDADINGLIDTKVDDTFVNDLFVDDLTTDADTTYSAGDGNITITSEKLYLAFVDLAELDNTISLFITKAVSDLTNYFTKTEVTASFDALPNLTSADVVTAVGNWSDDKSSYWDTATDLDTVISADEISEANIAFSTACAAGDYYRLNGNDLECTTPTDTDTFNSSSDIISVVNVTDSYWDIIAKDLFCTDCLTGTEIAELTDADVSNTLTASDLVAGSSVVSDAEVDNDITVETNHNITITGSGATLHFDVVNSTHGKIWMS